jgi:hypothetical protein
MSIAAFAARHRTSTGRAVAHAHLLTSSRIESRWATACSNGDLFKSRSTIDFDQRVIETILRTLKPCSG